MTVIEVISFATSIASLVLAIVAIALSIIFYQMSSQLSESTKEAAKDIGASVEKLEKLFDRLYADTFSMMKDTVSDMRKHAWGEAASETPNILEEAEKEAEKQANAKFDEIRSGVIRQIEEVLKKQEKTDLSIEAIKAQVKSAVDTGMKAARNLDQEETRRIIRSEALHVALKRMPCDPDSFIKDLMACTGLEEKCIGDELNQMLNEGIFQVESRVEGGYLGMSNYTRRIASLTRKGIEAAKAVAKHTSPSDTKEAEGPTKPSA